MAFVLAGLLLSIWGLMIYASPKRKRYSGRRRRAPLVGDDSIDGEVNDPADAYDVLAASDSTSHHAEHGGYDAGHHGGYDGGHYGGDFGGGGYGGHDGGGGHH
ncbi:MAG TPA: hypothetical protein VIV40_01835 [Kofleriaceae bacterium]